MVGWTSTEMQSERMPMINLSKFGIIKMKEIFKNKKKATRKKGIGS